MPHLFRPTSAFAIILSLMLPLLSATAIAQASAGQTFGAWSVECHGDDGRSQCVATQRVANDPDGRNVVLGVILEARQDGQPPLLTFRFSSRAFRPAGAGMKIDDNEPYRAPISACDESVCEVRAELGEQMSQEMRQGNLLVFAFFLDRDRQISFPVSLDGFTRALAAVTGG